MNFDKNRKNWDIFVMQKTRKFYTSEKNYNFLISMYCPHFMYIPHSVFLKIFNFFVQIVRGLYDQKYGNKIFAVYFFFVNALLWFELCLSVRKWQFLFEKRIRFEVIEIHNLIIDSKMKFNRFINKKQDYYSNIFYFCKSHHIHSC